MADKLNSGNIYTNAVGNNLVVVDPNKVVLNGEIKDRLVDHEDMVMYANLTAIIYPRSKVISGSQNQGDRIIVDIFDGELNFLKPKNSDFLNSDWTQAFTNPDVNKKVKTVNSEGTTIGVTTENTLDFQGFGITSINVKLNASYIPQVSINFTDVRGKTLFEQARGNTPYTAFFHLPYPTFYLTLKGYYGKAVKYQLTMEKFSSRFDPASGDYLVTCNFVGNHVALLRDINMHQVLTAPYMYPTKCDASGCVTETRGKQVLKEVYTTYRQQGLIDENFTEDAEITLVDLIEKLKVLDNNLGKLFGESSLQMTTDRLEYDSLLKDLNKSIKEKDGWKDQYLNNSKAVTVQVVVPDTTTTGKTINVSAYPLKGIDVIPETEDPIVYKQKIVDEAKDKLRGIIDTFTDEANENLTFGKGGKYMVDTKLLHQTDLFEAQKVSGINVKVVDESELDTELEPWIIIDGASLVYGELFKKHKSEFEKSASKMSTEVGETLNSRLEAEIGFKPTIRNVFAIILAGADTFLRLMDIVHTNAMEMKSNPQRLSISKDSKTNDIVYPWPQYFVVEEEDECTTSSVLKYPGAKDVIENTGADNTKVWPEVYFVEEYTKTSVYKSSDFNLQTPNNAYVKEFIPINIYDWNVTNSPYNETYFVSVLWEILLRSQKTVRYGSVDTRFAGSSYNLNSHIFELAGYDGKNLYDKVSKSYSLNEFFKDVKSVDDVINFLKINDPERTNLFLESNTVTPQTNTKSYDFSYTEIVYSVNPAEFEENSKYVKDISKNFDGFFDLAPTYWGGAGGWIKANYSNGENIRVGDFYEIGKSLEYDLGGTFNLRDKDSTRYLTNKNYCFSFEVDTLARFNDVPKKLSSQPKEFYKELNTHTMPLGITEGEIVRADTTTFSTMVPVPGSPAPVAEENNSLYTSMLNTPYLINSIQWSTIQENLGQANPYASTAYLFLNSLPLPTFREKVLLKGVDEGTTEFGSYVSQIFNQIPAIHDVPVSFLLRIGSIWHRYKEQVNGTGDILGPVFHNLGGPAGAGSVYDPASNNINQTFTYTDSTGGGILNYNGSTTNFGVYQAIIESIHYIASGNNTPPVTNLNNVIGVGAPLTISQNPNITTNNSNFKFFDVYLDSANVTNPLLGAKGIGSDYFILYPSSGALIDTDIDSYSTPNVAWLNNGGCRMLWGMSNYGYFQHNPNYKPQEHRYFKKIDNTQEQQIAWQLRPFDVQDYSTIEELRGVFNSEQLDFFESLFLKFSTPDGDTNLGGSMKQIIKDITVIEKKWFNSVDTNNSIGRIEELLAKAQLKKFGKVMTKFLNKRISYVHRTTTNVGEVINNSTLIQKLKDIESGNNEYEFGNLTPGSIPPLVGSQEDIDIKLHVGQYYSQDNNQFTILTTNTLGNPILNFFATIRNNGIEFNSENIKGFAPFIRLYAAHCANSGIVPASTYLTQFMSELDNLNAKESQYMNQLLKVSNGNISDEENTPNQDMADSRTSIEGDDLKLDLYNQFKTLNDRWISGLDLQTQTLFQRFLFFDRANKDIGDSAIINIWDIIKLDTPFDSGNEKTLTQSISSYLSTILANNYFNYIPLPSYINFYSVGGDNTQKQGNAMFGTFKTVDYLDSSPVFLCQYVGKPSSQLNNKAPNNGYANDGFALNLVSNNPLAGPDCGNKKLSNKVMGFTVDFGIPNQNMFESITLDQEQFQNTSESYKILQQMADSGGGGSTSMASSSLYNVYASRSYTAKVTCIGNVTIQPTQYFQLRYLPMFNGPYLIINVEHNISPNNIETTFEGVRVPIPKLPNITDLVQRVEEKLYAAAETRLQEKIENVFYDDNDATPKQLKLTPEDNGYLDLDNTPWVEDNIKFELPIDPTLINPQQITNSETRHLGIDLTPIPSQTTEVSSEEGIIIRPVMVGTVIDRLDGCKPQQKDKGCARYGNYVITQKTILEFPGEGETAYYKVKYANLREGEVLTMGQDVSRISTTDIAFGDVIIGKLGNSGMSRGPHLHLEVIRGVVNSSGRIVEHYLNPERMFPEYYS